MPNKMLIDATHPEETRVVVVRGNRVEEFDFETAQRKQLRGNIYLAKVTRVEPSLQAAFIEYGGNRHGFLAFSEIHPDYYQIPVADRQALIEADERAHREAEEESENRSSNRHRGRSRHRNARRRGHGERVQSDVVDNAAIDPAQAAQPYEGEAQRLHEGAHPDEAHAHETDHHPADSAEHGHDHGQVAHDHDDHSHEHGRPQEGHAQDRVQDHVHDHAPDHAAAEAPVASFQSDAAPVEAVAAPAEATASAESHEDHAHHDEPAHDARHDDEHALENAAHADDAPRAEHAGEEYAAASHEDRAPAPEGDEQDDEAQDDEDDGEDAEEEVVESVGGDDVLEEVPERAFRPRRQYKIQEVIKRRQVMLVQVVKEERGNKGAALTTYLSLAGRYAVLMPNTARGGGISRKITSAQDRSRLKEVVQDLDVPEGMGIILRTAGASRTKPEIKRDFEYLIRMWETVRDMTLKSQAPTLVYEEGSLIKRSLRDLYNKEIDEIQVAGQAGYDEARDFMKMLMPSNVRAVRQYRDGQPLFSRMGVESQLDAMFSPTVQLRSGGYIVINQTEALVSIDVNSGRSTREHHIEDTALKTNLEASEEVARQLRLRDLAGLIVIDFIDMDEKRNNRAVERKLSDCLRQDRARIQVGRISHFGLLEMSRQRIRASVLESSTEPCAHCGGSGHVRSVSSVALQLLRGIEEILMKGATHNLVVRTRTDVALYVLNHKRGHLRDLENAFKVTLAVVADPTVAGQQSFIIDRGEQVHTLEAAKALLAAQAAASPSQVEEAYDDEEPFDIEGEVETEETEGLTEEAAGGEEVAGESEADGHRRKRRRRRRGRGEPREGGAPRDDNDALRVAPESADGAVAVADDGEADDDEGDEQGAVARSEQGPNGERRPRRRGRRGGRRRRGSGPEDGLAGSISDELGPTPVSEVTSAVADFDGRSAEAAPTLVEPEPVSQPPQPQWQPAEHASPETVSSAPTPTPEETAQEADRAAARRRSTVREKVSFLTSAPSEPAPAISHSEAEPAATAPAPAPAEPAPAATSEAAPRKAGWWSRRFGSGE
ncbi:ribonuclease E/G [Bradyrhizobium sp. AUGA SZCCT0431]|uniref:Rne/Rng family ribonuclease n=1 Tax=Bradyrhizobium sp. AUGA SZCCT0431 TaxID=2807674 RepID=UPI001BA5A376|nr:ribonuclease E/G [Bradyrhizobium sp. AUGA SZCCT0431]MBR1143389.1 Rne/Rng family ribonuclease [Bradyrhizobium sp. AUGA SZCCT0431]